MTGTPPGPDLAAIIAERSGGNPLLATELARQLARQGTSTGEARVMVPGSVRVITRARLAELEEPTRSVIGSAAVLGASFRRDILARLTGLPAGDLAEALAAGRDARLLEPAGPGEDRFRHELVRDAIYDAIPEAVREERHARAGAVLAELAAEALRHPLYRGNRADQGRGPPDRRGAPGSGPAPGPFGPDRDVLRLRPGPAHPLVWVMAGLTSCGPISRPRGRQPPSDGRKINAPNE